MFILFFSEFFQNFIDDEQDDDCLNDSAYKNPDRTDAAREQAFKVLVMLPPFPHQIRRLVHPPSLLLLHFLIQTALCGC
jgi:hypothetical protein